MPQTLWGPTLYHIEDVPFREDMSDVPTVFTPFKQKVRHSQDYTPSKSSAHIRAVMPCSAQILPLYCKICMVASEFQAPTSNF